MPLSRSERALRGRLAAYAMHASHDAKLTTAAARAAFDERFLREVDPNGEPPEAERARRADAARRRYFTALAFASAKARRERKDAAR